MLQVKARKGLARGPRKKRVSRRRAIAHRPIPYPMIHRKQRAVNRKREAAKAIEDPWKTLSFVLMTEKCVRMIEEKNILTFIVARKSNKFEVAQAFEKVFEKDVLQVRTIRDQKNRKKAFIRLKEPNAAGDIAIKLGII